MKRGYRWDHLVTDGNPVRLVAGFTLPAVVIMMGAMLLLAAGALLFTGVERITARSVLDQKRAELAAESALQAVCSMLRRETSNDDYVVLQSVSSDETVTGRDAVPYLLIARGRAEEDGYAYRYAPLFSSIGKPGETSQLTVPIVSELIGDDEIERADFTAHSYQENVHAAWIPILDEKGRSVARYAYWVEDLQGRIDPALAGNVRGAGKSHLRTEWPFPAPGLNDRAEDDAEPALDQLALYAIHPEATHEQQLELGKTLIGNRELLISPESVLAAGEVSPPLMRDAGGHLADPVARSVEENLIAGLCGYDERPLVPFAEGIDPAVAGEPRQNLNRLLRENEESAVDEMAAFIDKALPHFSKRKGGFPDDYLRTLAANALDYADVDHVPRFRAGEFRGLDAYPLLSEIALQVNYEGISNEGGRKIMKFTLVLFAELHNPTNQPVEGNAQLSYEVALAMDGIGSGTGSVRFDSPELLSNEKYSKHSLDLEDGRYWTSGMNFRLAPNQYRAEKFAIVSYKLDVGSASEWIPGSMTFSLEENRGAAGVSLKWNGNLVDRADGIVRQEGLASFKVGTKKTVTKAALPGHVYDNYWPAMYYNMGDPRISFYLRKSPLGENAYPENISPNRRNVRLKSYASDIPAKTKTYARVLPSEWPDGGHNSVVGNWSPGTNDRTEMDDPQFDFSYDPQMEFSAIQVISNRGRFYSTTELGRVFDPILFKPLFENAADTAALLDFGRIPEGERWPDARPGQESDYYGGGNTLRIGRQEHPAFDVEGDRGRHATRLLDLFHVGRSRSESEDERAGPLVRIQGHVNLNTASRAALRAMAAGALAMDPQLAEQTSTAHDDSMMPPKKPLGLAVPADRIADAIIRCRPYATTSDLAFAKEADGTCVFGNRQLYPEDQKIEWSDAACEELFARVYEGATVRSRNFRVWVIAQTISAPKASGVKPEVLAEVRRCFTVFADPGERNDDGSIQPEKFKTAVMTCNDF